jgi:hypothetical protein
MWGVESLRGVETLTIVADAQANRIIFIAQANPGFSGLRMALDIGQGFLRDPEQNRLDQRFHPIGMTDKGLNLLSLLTYNSHHKLIVQERCTMIKAKTLR